MMQVSDDIFAKVISAGQILSLPILSAIFAMVWDNWKKSRAVYEVVFGNPNRKDDDGLAGEITRHDKEIGRLFTRAKLSRYGES